MQSYEIEVKALLGSPERAEEVRQAMKKADPACTVEARNKQLNHYFTGGTLENLAKVIAPHISGVAEIRLDNLAEHAKSFSVRTRDKDGRVYIVVKAAVDDTSSSNGISRMEIEEKVALSLEALDKLVLSAGFSYQAKWSREREEYFCLGTNVTLDKNAGYGWLAEFEKMIDEPVKVDAAKKEILTLMDRLGIEELPQSRLERMFDFYNRHWKEYYGTDKIFVVE